MVNNEYVGCCHSVGLGEVLVREEVGLHHDNVVRNAFAEFTFAVGASCAFRLMGFI